jgi:hypothetical protein
MAVTLRIPPELHARCVAYASSLGISLNALVSVALADYIDARLPSKPSGGPSGARAGLSGARSSLGPVKSPYRAPKRRTDPCPCGALRPDGRPITWKHCHGKPSLPGSVQRQKG